MTDPTRLSAEPESEFELRLLRSGRVEPPPRSKEKAWAAASDALAASLVAGSAAAGGRWAAGSAKAGWLTGLHGWWMFALGAGVLASGMALGLAHRGHSGRAPSAHTSPRHEPSAIASEESASSSSAPSNAFGNATPVPPASAFTQLEAREPSLAAAAPPSAPRHAHLTPGPSTERPTRADAPPPASASRSDTGASNVAAELALLDDARRAAERADFGHALSALDDYRAKFPRGAMTAEATVLRIGVLVRAGDRAAAKRIADAFLATDPDTLYVSRVQSLLAGTNP